MGDVKESNGGTALRTPFPGSVAEERFWGWMHMREGGQRRGRRSQWGREHLSAAELLTKLVETADAEPHPRRVSPFPCTLWEQAQVGKIRLRQKVRSSRTGEQRGKGRGRGGGWKAKRAREGGREWREWRGREPSPRSLAHSLSQEREAIPFADAKTSLPQPPPRALECLAFPLSLTLSFSPSPLPFPISAAVRDLPSCKALLPLP